MMSHPNRDRHKEHRVANAGLHPLFKMGRQQASPIARSPKLLDCET